MISSENRFFRLQAMIAISSVVSLIGYGARFSAFTATDFTVYVGAISPAAIASVVSFGIAIAASQGTIDRKTALILTGAAAVLSIVTTIIVMAILGTTPVGWIAGMLIALGSGALHTYSAYKAYSEGILHTNVD